MTTTIKIYDFPGLENEITKFGTNPTRPVGVMRQDISFHGEKGVKRLKGGAPAYPPRQSTLKGNCNGNLVLYHIFKSFFIIRNLKILLKFVVD